MSPRRESSSGSLMRPFIKVRHYRLGLGALHALQAWGLACNETRAIRVEGNFDEAVPKCSDRVKTRALPTWHRNVCRQIISDLV